ncbi:MAG: Ig-like domain-containing protein, partial [Ginsengibacter sp.]
MKQQIYLSGINSPYKSFSKIPNFTRISILLLFIFAGGCKKVTEEVGTKGICPIVVSTTPVSGATNVLLTTKVTATFNEEMNPLTINTTTFIIKQGTIQVAGTVTYTGMTATFTPANLLAANTVYT